MIRNAMKFPGTITLISAAILAANAATALNFTGPDTLSANSSANKTKLVRMGNGWLVSVFGDATEGSQMVYDLKADATRLSRDNFVRTCHPGNNESQCSLASDWSAPINLSNSADKYSIATRWDETQMEYPRPFYGDAEKPNIFVSGNFAVVTWVSKYCPGGNQRLISYNERDGISVPFSCVYASYTNNVAGLTDPVTDEHIPAVWNTVQLTDGRRDAKSDFNKGLKYDTKGLWAISWQEDPHGLQIGGADGPGDGASGASVTHGTDVWYTYTENLMNSPFAEPVRISDNYTSDGSGGNTSPVFHPDDQENEIESLERGKTGAARPNLMLTGVLDSIGTPPTAVIAYEESKGSDRRDSGKYIRYHEFPFNQPPQSQGIYQNGEPGCIISDPAENSRRVRFVSQHKASSNGLRMGVFWKQGLPTEGGPSDIMIRFGKTSSEEGSTGLRPEDMVPAVDPGCRVSAYDDAQLLANTPASNISSNTVPWSPVGGEILPPDNDLLDGTSDNPFEDARAHRAAIVGDDFYIGYSYAKDWAVATVTDMDNYNFWLRKYNAGANSWTVAKNVSQITTASTHVKEPRLVKTPGIGMGCTAEDIANSPYPENCPNKAALIVAWGTESNVYQHIGGSVEGDIHYTRTMDKAATFEEPVVVTGIAEGTSRFESQLRPSPGGNIVWTVWNESDATGKHAKLSVSDESGLGAPPVPPAAGETPPVPPPADSFNLLVESLVMDTTDPVVDEEGTYYVASKQQDIPASVTVRNIGGLEVSGTVIVETVQGGGFSFGPYEFTLGTDETFTQEFSWNTHNKRSYTWRATVLPTAGDRDIDDNIMEVGTTVVKP